MGNVPTRIETRLVNGIKKFQPILQAAKARDVGEADTVIIITDMLAEIFGYNKYSEITSELVIKGTYCDLATKIDGKVELLFEVKAIGLDLKEQFVKQAVDYATNQGIDWVVLTNGIIWRIYKVAFTKPINQELIFEFDFLLFNPKTKEHIEALYLLTKEGRLKSVLDEFHAQKQALSKFLLAALILSDNIVDYIRKELKKISPDVKVDATQIKNVILNDVLKREVVEEEKADEARKKIMKSLNRIQKQKSKNIEFIEGSNINSIKDGQTEEKYQNIL